MVRLFCLSMMFLVASNCSLNGLAVEPIVKADEFSNWTKSALGKKYIAFRKQQTVFQIQSEIVEKVRGGAKGDADKLKKELMDFKKIKDPIFVPFIAIDSTLSEKIGSIGQIATDNDPNHIYVSQVIDNHNAIVRYTKHPSIVVSPSQSDRVPVSQVSTQEYCWISGVDTSNFPTDKLFKIDSNLVFKVEGFKDYRTVLGAPTRVPHLSAIDAPQGVFLR